MKEFDLKDWRNKAILLHHSDELIKFFTDNKLIGAKINSFIVPENGVKDHDEILAMYVCDDEGNTICLPHKSILIDLPFIICTDKGRIEIDFSERGDIFVNIDTINTDVNMDNFNMDKFFDYIVDKTIKDIKYSKENDEEKQLKRFYFIFGGNLEMEFSKSNDYFRVSMYFDTSSLDKYNR